MHHTTAVFPFLHVSSSPTQCLMSEVVQNSNVVEVTNQLGFLENLETLQQRLSLCEKALAEYLETKRLTFPRFHFVSASDLLEIVSKGTQPKEVTDCTFYSKEIIHISCLFLLINFPENSGAEISNKINVKFIFYTDFFFPLAKKICLLFQRYNLSNKSAECGCVCSGDQTLA